MTAKRRKRPEVYPRLPGQKQLAEHGTRSRYVCGCRCPECRAANTAAYHARMARVRDACADIPAPADRRCPGIEGEPCRNARRLAHRSLTPICSECRSRLTWNGLVDAAPVRRHIRALSRRGVGYKQVADAADVGKTTVMQIRGGSQRRVRRAVAERILAVTVDAVADHGLIPAAPTWKLLDELREEFLSTRRLAHALGRRGDGLQIGRERITARTALRVQRFYRRVMRPEAVS